MIEKRSEPRTRTHLFGRIVFGPDRSVCDCLVSDLSSGGARLSLAYTPGNPRGVRAPYPLAWPGLSGVRHMARAPCLRREVPLGQRSRDRFGGTPIEPPCRGAALTGLNGGRPQCSRRLGAAGAACGSGREQHLTLPRIEGQLGRCAPPSDPPPRGPPPRRASCPRRTGAAAAPAPRSNGCTGIRQPSHFVQR